jgi:hypothetical protein
MAALGLLKIMRKFLVILFLFCSSAYSQEEVILSFDEKQICVPETDDCQSTLTVITTKNKYVFESLIGSFYHSKINNQILDCGGNTLRSSLIANLLNSNGTKLSIEHKNGIAECGLTNDQKYYFIVDETPILKVYDKSATLLLSQPVDFQSLVKYKIKGASYDLSVPGIP